MNWRIRVQSFGSSKSALIPCRSGSFRAPQLIRAGHDRLADDAPSSARVDLSPAVCKDL